MRLTSSLYITIAGFFLVGAILLCGCTSDESPAADGNKEIHLTADIWRVMEDTRTATFDTPAALQTEGHFTCAVYQAGTATPYIVPTKVEWDTDEWLFSDGKHYWPATGSLDFFAYMPATAPTYITALTYAMTDDPTPAVSRQFTCTALPYTSAGQSATKEFIYALQPGQSKAVQGATGVALNFKHPFARINLQWSAADHTGIIINSITFKNIKNNGTCTIDGSANPTWTPWGDAVDFTWTPSGDAVDFTVADMGGPFLVVPQTFTGGNVTIEVNATKEGDTETFTATVATAWAAGYSYTYSFTLNFKAKELIIDTTEYTEQW